MNTMRQPNWTTDLRIVWAITAKDILDALKNKAAISVVITALFTAVAYSFMPALTSLDNKSVVRIYDAANSSLSVQLKESQALEVYTYPTEALMKERLAGGEVPELGLVIPANFDQSQAIPGMTGYVLYWVSDEEIAGLTREVEAEITRLAGKPLKIQVAEERLIPQPDQNVLGHWVGAALVFLMIYTGLSLIANLMLEEKKTHTLEALLVSPASSWHVVIAKALTGLFYCLLGVAVTLAINQKIILHWGLIIPALLFGALFSVSLGLIASAMIEERGQLSLWTFGVLIPLFVPVFLSLMSELFPEWLNQIIRWIPTVTLFQLLEASFSVIPGVSTLLVQFAWLILWVIAGLACAAWLLRRQQQEEAGDQVSWIGKIGQSLRSPSRLEQKLPGASLAEAAAAPSNNIHALDQSMLPVKPASGLRIVQAIAANDIRQSIHNKTILAILVGSILLVISNAVFVRLISARVGNPSALAASSTPVLAIMVSICLMNLGVALVPLLMVEEKETHTLEALLISPARYTHVVAGKALAGAFYCLAGVLIILLAYHFMLVHLELALLALLLGTAFVVALGLLVGMASNNPTTLGMWAAAVLLILLVPVLLSGLGRLDQVPWLKTLVVYVPSTAIVKLFNLSMAAEIHRGVVMVNVSVLVSAAVALYLLVWWMIRRSDRL